MNTYTQIYENKIKEYQEKDELNKRMESDPLVKRANKIIGMIEYIIGDG